MSLNFSSVSPRLLGSLILPFPRLLEFASEISFEVHFMSFIDIQWEFFDQIIILIIILFIRTKFLPSKKFDNDSMNSIINIYDIYNPSKFWKFGITLSK